MDKYKWIEIARAGTFTDSKGRPQTFSAADLEQIATRYTPARRDAPLVLGHPETDAAPAFGWVKRLRSDGDRLYAAVDATPVAREIVNAGHYRHVSMSLMPDRVTLRHVALLGAAQPAIDGLAAVALSGSAAEAITVDFSTNEVTAKPGNEVTAKPVKNKGEDMTEQELLRQVGQLEAKLKSLETENAALKKQAGEHKAAADKAAEDKKAAEAKAEKANADFSAYRKGIEAGQREARVSALVSSGKITPAEKASVLEFAAQLGEQTVNVDFAAPDGKKETVTLEERYLRGLEARPVDARFSSDFSAPPAHAMGTDAGQTFTGPAVTSFNLADLTARL